MLREYLSNIADKFRTYLDTTEPINAQDFAGKVEDVAVRYNQLGFTNGYNLGLEEGKPLGKLELLQDSEYMNAKVSGTAIAVNDVSPIEHNVRCKVESKNLINDSTILDGYEILEDEILPNANWYVVSVDVMPTTQYSVSGFSSMARIEEDINGVKTRIYTNDVTFTTLPTTVKLYFNSNKSVSGNNQLELGTTATEYTPYVADVGGIEVSRYGKNLFDVNLDPHSIHYAVSLVSLNDGELTIKQNATAQYASYNIAIQNANNLVGKTITISCDCKVGEGGNNTSVRTMWLDANGGAIAGTDILYKPYVSSTEYQHISVSGVVNAQPDESHDTLALIFYGNVSGTLSDGECYAYFKNIQLELGTTATAYEPYTEPTTYQSTANGTVEGVKSISPNMTLLTNNNGVVINANYLRDIDTYIDNLITNVALTGGE